MPFVGSAAEGRAVLFSTHIMSEAEYLCDRILLIHEGRITDSGRLDELLARSGCANLTDAFSEPGATAASPGYRTNSDRHAPANHLDHLPQEITRPSATGSR